MKKFKRCNVIILAIMMLTICIGSNIKVDKISATATKWTRLALIGLSKDSQIIPSKSKRDGVEIVNDAKVLYRVKVKATCLYLSGSEISGKKIKFSNSNTENVKKVSSDTKTNSKGIAYAIYEVRGAVDFKVKATIDDSVDRVWNVAGSNKVTIDVKEKSKYEHKFKITAYCTALESDYSGAKVAASGLSGTYKKDFLDAVKRNGSGKTEGGVNIVYSTLTKKFSKGNPQTSSGTTPTVNRTISASSYCIPKKYIDKKWQRGCVTIAGIEKNGKSIYYRAEDAGDDFRKPGQWNIDVYTGYGLRTSEKFDDKYNNGGDNDEDRKKVVTYLGNNKDLW